VTAPTAGGPEPVGGPVGGPVGAVAACYRHPDRPTGIRCTRCERPICPECMTSASVGFQCPECVRAGRAAVRPGRGPFGGRVPRGTPVTLTLLAINVLAFLATAATGSSLGLNGGTSSLFDRFALIRGGTFDLGGQLVRIDGVATGQYERLITSAFLHFGILHIALNMYALYLLGPQLERLLGWWRLLAVYLLSGLSGGVLTYLLAAPTQESAGASGAIFGLFAAYFVVARKVGADTSAIVTTVGINLVITFLIPGISKTAHIGGLVTGAVAAAVIVLAPVGRRRLAVQVGGLALIVSVLVGLTVSRTVTLRGATDVPTSAGASVPAGLSGRLSTAVVHTGDGIPMVQVTRSGTTASG